MTVVELISVIVACLGFVIDVGRVINARRQLQASSDAAAQAGAILASSFGSVAGMLFLALTTPMVDLTDQLREHLSRGGTLGDWFGMGPAERAAADHGQNVSRRNWRSITG